jgi:hypothetical protein
MNVRALPLLAGALCLGGCAFDVTPAGPEEHETRVVERDNAELVRVTLKMGAGDLNVRGGAPKLMQGDFTYNVPSWKPEVRYNNTGVRGDLTIEQGGKSHTHSGNLKYQWDVALNDEVPLDLNVDFGAGKAHLDLGSLSLRTVKVDMGVGEMRMDLRGNPKRDYTVRVDGGVGQATLLLPANVGISAEAVGGIGGIKTQGLRSEAGHWVNDAFDHAKVKITVSVHGGVGSINLIAE